MPAGRATMAGLGAVTPESGVRPSTRYLVLGVEPEVTRVSPGAYSGRRRP
jgi:hypothetical protein